MGSEFFGKRWKIIIPFLLALAFLLDGIFFEQPPSPVPWTEFITSGFNVFDWNVYVVTNDSIEYSEEFNPSYSLTPPVYHWFIQLFGKTNTIEKRKATSAAINVFDNLSDPCYGQGYHNLGGEGFVDRLSNPCYRVVFVQKVLFLAALVLMCVALSNFIPPPIVGITIFILFKRAFFAGQINGILSEGLTQTILIVVASILIFFINKPQKILVPLAGFFCAAAYLTRPAAAYATVLLFCMVIYGLSKDWRRYLSVSLLSFFLVGLAYTFEATRIPQNKEGVNVTSDFQRNIVNFGYAALLAEPADVALMPDTLSQNVLKDVIIFREKKNFRYVDRLLMQRVIRLLRDDYNIKYFSKETSDLFKNVCSPILEKYYWKYIKLQLSTLKYAISTVPNYTRIGGYYSYTRYYVRKLLSFWLPILAAIVLINFFIHSPWRWVSVTFVLVHYANCLITVVFGGIVNYRYINDV